MKKKLISMLLTGLMIFSLLPINMISVSAEETVPLPPKEMMTDIHVADRDALIKKYPELAYMAVNEKIISGYTDFTPEINAKINEALTLLKEAEIKKDKVILLKALDMMLNVYSTAPDLELIKVQDSDQFDYFFAKSIYVGFLTTKEGNERDKFFSDLMDNYYLHSISGNLRCRVKGE